MKKKCRFGQKYLFSYFLGEISGEIAAQVEVHLRSCPDCQQDLAIFQAIKDTSQKMKKEIELELAEVDWNELPIAIERKIQDTISKPKEVRWLRPFFLRWSTVASVIIGLILGLIAYHYLLRPKEEATRAQLTYQVPGAFLERVDEEMARKEVLDYLEKSQLVLIAMKEAAEGISPGVIPLPQEKLRNLLRQKKYFSSQLDSFPLAKAKQILEEIDALLLELALIEEGSSPDEARQLVRLIDDRRLLLKIQLLQQELKESEGIT